MAGIPPGPVHLLHYPSSTHWLSSESGAGVTRPCWCKLGMSAFCRAKGSSRALCGTQGSRLNPAEQKDSSVTMARKALRLGLVAGGEAGGQAGVLEWAGDLVSLSCAPAADTNLAQLQWSLSARAGWEGSGPLCQG